MVAPDFQEEAKTIVKLVLYLPHLPLDLMFCRLHGLKWSNDWRLMGWPLIQKARGAKIEIGQRFFAVSKSRYNSWGVIQPVIIKARRPGCLIRIGDDVGLSGCTITAIKKIMVGNKVLVGSGVIIADNDAHSINPECRRYSKEITSEPVIIKDNVFIGARAMILKGVTVGTGAVVGAGSVVTRDVPDYAIVAGNPARVLGDSRRKS
ncbi:MAG: acyltransferase [Gammaproteobacteria bacterium]|nr:acyltransferase [Gammaproteobacteria bacterium]